MTSPTERDEALERLRYKYWAKDPDLRIALDTINRLSGKMCLVCGRTQPCTETPEACTFDPDPISAAQGFQKRAEEAEARMKEQREHTDLLDVLEQERGQTALLEARLNAAIEALKFQAGHIEALAFDIEPPNPHTPKLVMQAQAMRNAADAIVREHEEKEDG